MNTESLLSRRIAVLLLLLSFVGIIVLKRLFYSHGSDKKFNIAILQTVSHPALDQAREGFMHRLKILLKDNVSFIVQNAEGSTSQAQLLASSMVSRSYFDGFFAIATPALSVLSDMEKRRPIFIAAVSDPRALGVMYKGTNVSGSSDMIDVEAEVKMLHTLLPSVKRVAILYNTSEVNSKILAKRMRESLISLGLEPIEVGFSSVLEITSALNFACSKADAILTPTDNSIASTIQTIVQITLKANKPLIVSDNLLVKEGALASMGVDYYESGKAAADIAYKVLVNEVKPDQIPLAQAKNGKVVINRKVLNEFGLSVPEELVNKAEFVN